MEADAFEANVGGSQWVAEDSSEQAACHGTADENMGSVPSLNPSWENSTPDVLTEQLTSLWTSPNSSTLAGDGLFVNLERAQDFQHIPFCYSARSLSSPHVPPVTETEMPSGRKNPESRAAFDSPPWLTQEALFSQTMKQTPGEQEQLMRQQMEHLQRIVAEQQKIITFYNPGVPAALFSSHFSLGTCSQIQSQECPQINPLIIKPTSQPCCTTRASADNPSKEASEEHPEETGANMEPKTENHESTTDKSSRQNPEGENSAGAEESWLETLPTLAKEQGEKQILEHSSPSPFGVRMDARNKNGDDRPIRPGIGVRQRTFEEFVEEQLKIDSQRTEKLHQTSCEMKVTPQKSFLKCGEGLARFEKIKVNPSKNLARHHQQDSLDGRNNYLCLAGENTGECQRKCQQLKRAISSRPRLLLDDKSTKCTISKDYARSHSIHHQQQHHGKEEGKKDSDETYDPEGVMVTSEKGSDLPNGSNCSQEQNEQRSGIQVQAVGGKKASYPECQPYQKVPQERSIDSEVPLQFMMDSENKVSPQMLGKTMDAAPGASDLYHTEASQTNQKDQNSIFQVIRGISQCENEYCDARSKSPEIQIEISPEFKKVNDQIVKITPNPDRKPEGMTAHWQKEHHSQAVGAPSRGRKTLQRDSDCTSTESEDEPPFCCSQNASRQSARTAAVTSKSTGHSDADYATDVPSGYEDHSLKSHRPLLTQRCSGQEPTGQKEATVVTTPTSPSSSDSGHRESSLRCGKMSSLLRKSFRSSQTATGGRGLEAQRNCTADSESREFRLKPSFLASHLVASLFPVFKSKTDPEGKKRAAEECDQNRQVEKLKECEGAVLLHPQETSLLAQMKEEQAKAMAILRSQITQLEVESPGKMSALEECHREKALKMQGKGGVFEEHTIMLKEEREVNEIQMLKQQIAKLQEEFRRNETQWHAAHGKLKSQLEALTKQNLELQDELRISEHQKMESERKSGHVAFLGRRAETPVSAAILTGTSSQETLEERVLQSRHRSPSSGHVGRKVPQDVLAPRNRKTQATRSLQPSSELSRSITGEQRVRSPPKTLRNRSATPTGRRTPHQMPFEVQKGLPQLDQIQQQRYGKNPSSSASVPNMRKDTSHSSYMTWKIFANSASSSPSCDSEKAAFLNNQNNDLLRSTSSDKAERGIEDLQICKEPSGEVAAITDSSGRNSALSNGRKTPSENVLASLDATRKASPLKSILSRRRLQHTESKEDGEVKEKIEYPDGKVKQLLMDGRRITTYPNGTKLEISADKRTTLVNFYNGDIKKTLPDQTVIYYYADAQTTRTVFPNGMEVLQFPNKQIEAVANRASKEIVVMASTTEKYYPDGTEEIVFPDRTVKLRYDGGFEETVFPDGTIVKVEKSGVKTIQFRNGPKEIHTAASTRREYPDGTIKTVYLNGQPETKYLSGRIQNRDERKTIIADKK